MGSADGRGVTGYRFGPAEEVGEGAAEVESVDEAEGVALTFSASISEEGASKAA